MNSTEAPEVKDGDIRIRVIQDSDPEHPRRDWDQIDTMNCWHRRYELGDENPHENSTVMFLDLIPEDAYAVLRHIIVAITKVEDGRQVYLAWCEGTTRESRRQNWYDFVSECVDYPTVNQALLDAARKVAMIMPLYLYDHSGLTMSTSGFSCPWDSGQVGWIYMPFKKFIEETGYASAEEKASGKLGEESLKKLEEWLTSSVATYDQFLRGDVHGFVMETASVCDQGHVHWEDGDSCWGFYGTEFNNGMADHIPEEHYDKLREALANPEYS